MKKINLILSFLIIPLLCCCAQVIKKTNDKSVFEYKEIYLADAIPPQNRQLGLNSIDEDWGLWGHNLKRVLPKSPNEHIYAIEGGELTKKQFCFSSDQLYEYIVQYIIENWGEEDSLRFAILLNDNNIVCQCRKCQKAGNTENNASPTVLTMIEKLAKRFPNHIFFTSHYNTTKGLPGHKMPDNTGVLISAIDYPLSPIDTDKDIEFENLLKQWSQKVNHVYVWDYINNFDDYFTPFPIFRAMQHRLQMYAKNKVKGIFLNGSGTDYSTWEDIHTMVLAELLRNPHQDYTKLVKSTCEKLYLKEGKLFADFILTQENWTAKQGKALPFYGGISQAMKSYLPTKEFIDFHNTLTTIVQKKSGRERIIINRLLCAMSFTRLELMRVSGDIDGYEKYYNNLSTLKDKDTKVYNEACWTVESYLNDYKEMAKHAEEVKNKNLLLGKRLIPLTKLDEEYNDINILTDGLLGLPSNYHCGQLISSATPSLQIAIPEVSGMKRICVWMTRNTPYHIIFPEKITLTCEGIKIAEAVPKPTSNNPNRSVVELNIPSSVKGDIEINIIRNTEERTMAIDEIEAF